VTLTSEQKRLVRSTWEMVITNQDDAARLFYARLFEIDPSTRALFASANMAEQGEKFMKTITTMVAELEYPDILRPGIEALGRRHVGYGAKEEHYESVGAALLWTLGRVLGEEFTPEVQEAWAEIYGMLAIMMKDAATGYQRRAEE
jgi:hemoglobin-like flavoprotein